MRSDKLGALHDFRQLTDGVGGDLWLSALVIVIGLLILVFTIGSTLALPIFLVRLHLRLKAVERRLDELLGRKLPHEPRDN